MLDDFMLAEEPAADPLDFGPPATPPFVQPQVQKQDMGALLKLAALLPLAMKGGQPAIQGLLAGFQQAQAQKRQQGRLDARDAQTQAQQSAQQQSLDAYRKATLEQQAKTRQQALLKQFGDAVGTLDDPAAVQALLAMYGPQASALGLDRAALDSYASTVATPTRLQQKAAEKRIAALKRDHGEKWMEAGQRFVHTVNGEPVPFPELLRRAGYTEDPNAPQAPDTKPETRSIEVQAADALARGDMVAYERLKRVKKEIGMADDRPGDPRMAELNRQIAEMRLEALQAAAGQGAQPSPRQVTLFNQIASAYDRSPLVRAADRTVTLADAVKAIRENPSDPARQMALAYGYIQALDSYQSAVREGELGNLGRLATQWEQLKVAANRTVFEGAFMAPDTARNIADNAERLVSTLNAAADRKRKEFAARAQTSGIGDLWADFSARVEGTTPTSRDRRNRVLPPDRRDGATPAAPATPSKRDPLGLGI